MLSKLFHTHYFISYNPRFSFVFITVYVKDKKGIIFFTRLKKYGPELKDFSRVISVVLRLEPECRGSHFSGLSTSLWEDNGGFLSSSGLMNPSLCWALLWLSFLDFGCPLYTPLNGYPPPTQMYTIEFTELYTRRSLWRCEEVEFLRSKWCYFVSAWIGVLMKE